MLWAARSGDGGVMSSLRPYVRGHLAGNPALLSSVTTFPRLRPLASPLRADRADRLLRRVVSRRNYAVSSARQLRHAQLPRQLQVQLR